MDYIVDFACLLFKMLHMHRGQSPMHVLGHYGKENAAAIFELFLECMPEYPLDKPDNEGNTGTEADLIIILVKSIQIAYEYQCHTCDKMIMNLILLQFCSWPT